MENFALPCLTIFQRNAYKFVGLNYCTRNIGDYICWRELWRCILCGRKWTNKNPGASRASQRNPMFPRYDVRWSRAIPRLRAWLRRCSSINVRAIYPGTTCTCRSIRYSKRTLDPRTSHTLRLNKSLQKLGRNVNEMSTFLLANNSLFFLTSFSSLGKISFGE